MKWARQRTGLMMMKRIFRNIHSIFFYLLIAVVVPTNAFAQFAEFRVKPPDQFVTDSASYEFRSLDKEIIEEIKKNDEFSYAESPTQGTTLWQRVLAWLLDFFTRLFYLGGQSSVGKYLIYGLIIAALIFTILKLLNVPHTSLLQRTSAQNINYKIENEDIHLIPFESQIAAAIEVKNYKLAVRLYYLFALKNLTDSNLIEWKPGKSNAKYIKEIKLKPVRNAFVSLSQLFDYCWYGGFEIDKVIIDRSRDIFKNLNAQLQ